MDPEKETGASEAPVKALPENLRQSRSTIAVIAAVKDFKKAFISLLLVRKCLVKMLSLKRRS